MQQEYNEAHGITPKTIIKKVSDVLEISTHADDDKKYKKQMTPEEKQRLIDNIKASLVFASDADCEAAAAEIIFTPQA
jgi:excinuclease ABC subunit B